MIKALGRLGCLEHQTIFLVFSQYLFTHPWHSKMLTHAFLNFLRCFVLKSRGPMELSIWFIEGTVSSYTCR